MTPDVARSRKPEGQAKAVGVHTPSEVTVIMHDGTGSIGFPRLRPGGVRNMTPVHSEVVLEPLFGPVGHTTETADAAHNSRLTEVVNP